MFFLLFFSMTLFFGFLGTLLLKRRVSYEQRLQKFLPRAVEPESEAVSNQQIKRQKDVWKEVFHLISKQFAGRQYIQRWKQKIEEAGMKLNPEEFFVIRLLSVVGLFFITFILEIKMLAFIFPLIGWILPVFYLKRQKEKRLQRCAVQLPQTLGTMATAMKSGFSFIQAMQLVGKEIPDPIGPEFTRTIREINLGISTETAFQNLLQRLPNDDLKIFVSALLIQRSTGGNLAQILETIQETITERVRIKEDLKTLTSQGRMSAWVISLLPILIGIILNMMNPEYFVPMLQHPIGWLMLGMGIISLTIGWIFIQRIVKIEV
jgi:tight adherence protein B